MPRDHISRTIKLSLVAAGLWGFYLGYTYPAASHDAPPSRTQPLGWKYGFECCSASDCEQVRDDDVKVTEYGYQITRTKEVIPYNDPRIKRSRDEFYHRCMPGGNPDALRSLCLYVPDRQG